MSRADDSMLSIGALNHRSMLLRINSLPTASTSSAGTSVMASSTVTSFARKRANGSARRRSTISLMMLRASTNASATSIVRFVAESAYRTNSATKSGASSEERVARASSPTSAATSTAIPSSRSLVLSRNGLRPCGAELRRGGVGTALTGDGECRSVSAIYTGYQPLATNHQLILRAEKILELAHELTD